MRINVGQLQRVVKEAINDDRASADLKNELISLLPGHINEGITSLNRIVAQAADALDRMSALNYDIPQLSEQIAEKYSTHKLVEVRKIVAMMSSGATLQQMIHDKDESVAFIALKSSPTDVIKEEYRKNRTNDNIRSLLTQRLNEEKAAEDFNNWRKKKVVPWTNSPEVPELSDVYYDQLARDFIRLYGSTIDSTWEEVAVARFVSSNYATNGVKIDKLKLINKIIELQDDHDDRVLERDALKESLNWLTAKTEVMPIIEEDDIDPVKSLLESKQLTNEFIKKAHGVFNMRKVVSNNSLCEGPSRGNVKAQVTIYECTLPAGYQRSIDEQALDLLTAKLANKATQNVGRKIISSWSSHPIDETKVLISLK